MTENILKDNPTSNGKSPDINSDVNISTDKELLEDFLNSIDLGIGLDSIEDIESEVRLDRFLWVIRQKEIELEKCIAIAEQSINRTQSWLDKKSNTINSGIEYLTRQMQNYLRQNKLKSLSLPNGSLGFRKQPETVEITDDTLFLEKAKSEFIRHVPEKFEPDIKAIKSYIKETSEIPQGVELKSKEDKFYYKLSDN